MARPAPPGPLAPSDLPFPEDQSSAAAPVTASSHPIAPRPIIRSTLSAQERALLDEVPPPLWQQILTIPFATRGRQVTVGLIGFVVLAILGLSHFIDSHQPRQSGSGPIIDTSSGRPIVLPPDTSAAPMERPTNHVTEASAPFDDRKRAAEAAMDVISDALRAYAAQKQRAPAFLGGDGRELQPYADVATALHALEGKRFEYEVTTSVDGTQDEMTLVGEVAGSRIPVTRTVLFYRPR